MYLLKFKGILHRIMPFNDELQVSYIYTTTGLMTIPFQTASIRYLVGIHFKSYITISFISINPTTMNSMVQFPSTR